MLKRYMYHLPLLSGICGVRADPEAKKKIKVYKKYTSIYTKQLLSCRDMLCVHVYKHVHKRQHLHKAVPCLYLQV